MSVLIKAFVGLAVLAGVAVLPAPASQVDPKPATTQQALAAPQTSRAVQLAQDVADSDCFVARKKSVKRKAANYVRLVKVCE